jgi:hypothetical protein
MRSLSQRLARLEAATAGLLEGPWLWSAKEAAVRKYTMEAMSPEEQVLLSDSFGVRKSVGFSEFMAMHPMVWARYLDAFERALGRCQPPYVMSISDLWGWW